MYKFRSNTFSKSQIPSLIPGHEEKCSVVIGCCRLAASMQHIYLQSSILRASTVSQSLISVHQEIIGCAFTIKKTQKPRKIKVFRGSQISLYCSVIVISAISLQFSFQRYFILSVLLFYRICILGKSTAQEGML